MLLMIKVWVISEGLFRCARPFERGQSKWQVGLGVGLKIGGELTW